MLIKAFLAVDLRSTGYPCSFLFVVNPLLAGKFTIKM